VPPGTEGRTGWVGWPLPGVEVRVKSDDGSRHARPPTGVLETRGHNVLMGYWRRPAADATAFTPDGWFISGDIAEIDAEGCVRLLGRTGDLIISGGLNVYPSEVERVLDAIPGVAQSAVFGVPHPDFGEAVVAAIETDRPLEEADVIAAARKRLAPYKAPKRVIALAELPRNRMGKTLKAELRAAYRTLFENTSETGKDA
jgi:malonyl-CoA/methylmalonyl-CoA synthetase